MEKRKEGSGEGREERWSPLSFRERRWRLWLSHALVWLFTSRLVRMNQKAPQHKTVFGSQEFRHVHVLFTNSFPQPHPQLLNWIPCSFRWSSGSSCHPFLAPGIYTHTSPGNGDAYQQSSNSGGKRASSELLVPWQLKITVTAPLLTNKHPRGPRQCLTFFA